MTTKTVYTITADLAFDNLCRVVRRHLTNAAKSRRATGGCNSRHALHEHDRAYRQSLALAARAVNEYLGTASDIAFTPEEQGDAPGAALAGTMSKLAPFPD